MSHLEKTWLLVLVYRSFLLGVYIRLLCEILTCNLAIFFKFRESFPPQKPLSSPMMNVIIQVLKKKCSESCKYVIIYFVKTYCLIFESKMGKAKQQGNKTTKFHPLFKTNERSHFSGKVNSGKKPSERPEVMGSKISYNKSIKPKSQKNLAFTFCLSQFETSQNLQ